MAVINGFAAATDILYAKAYRILSQTKHVQY